MFVETLHIHNIRSYQNAALEFSQGINLIAGVNNSGKSTILRCLQRLQQQLPGISKEDVRKTNSSGKFHVRISGLTIDDTPLFQPKESSTLIGKAQDIFFTFWAGNGPGKSEDKLQCIAGSLKITLEENDITASLPGGGEARSDSFVSFPGFPAMENEHNFIFPFLARRKTSHFSQQQGVQSSFTITEQFYNLPARIQNLMNDTHPFSREYKKYCEAILKFVPGKMAGAQAGEEKIGMFVGNEIVYLESMGEGVINVLGLLAILLTEDNKLFLIEELENDIHPEGLKKLLSLILEKSKNNQFVISTHSNIILKYLASDPRTKIFYTDWQLKEIKKPNRIRIPTSTITPVGNDPQQRLQILYKLGYDLFDFDLYSSYLILEESSAEQLIRDFLIPQFTPSLQGKLRTISAGGASGVGARFDDFLRLFVFIHTSPVYHQKAWVLADGDEEGRTHIDKLRKKFRTWPPEHFVNLTQRNVESYYPKPFQKEFDNIISNVPDGMERLHRKGELTRKMLEWTRNDPQEARKHFKKSADEIISLLRKIESKI
jgi:predicted ATPase